MMFKTKVALISTLAPAALACLGYEGGVPVPTAYHTNSAVIVVEAGQVYDAGWAQYDRGWGACHEQEEGGTASLWQIRSDDRDARVLLLERD